MDNYKDFAETTLAADISTTSETAITVTSGTPFPAVPFRITIGTEIMHVTSKGSGTDWTVVRGYDSSTAAVHASGDKVEQNWAAGDVAELAALIAAKLPLAGGALVGPLVMDNMEIQLVKLLTLHGEVDDGNSGAADTINWNTGAAHKSTLTGNVTLAFTGGPTFGDTIVPTMTGYTAPSGIVTESSSYMDVAWQVFDASSSSQWFVAAYPCWVGYQFTTPKTIRGYAILPGSSRFPKTWTLAGSNNGTDWTTVDSRTNVTLSADTMAYFVASAPASYLYYRLTVTVGTDDTYLCIKTLRLIEDVSGIYDPSAPCFLTLKLIQDATGGRTVTWPATVKGTITVASGANAVTIIHFYWDGTYYWPMSVASF